MAVGFGVESWIWFGVVMWIACSRFISRRLVLGSFKAFQADDYVMVVALAFYITLIVTINIVAVSNSNLLPPDYDVAHLTAQDIAERTYGSKLILVVEECQCVVIWSAKACLLIMYLRFTKLAKENLAIKILAGYVAGSFLLMEILYLGVWCQPFDQYWAVPTDNHQCDAATNHLITNAVLNLTSDIAMLVIGLPIFIRVQMPMRQKIPVIALFSLGIFVIVSAILNKAYSFTNPFGGEWVFWYVRESSTALIVANMPFVWSFYRRLVCLQPVTKEERVRAGSCERSGSATTPSRRLLSIFRSNSAEQKITSSSQRSHSLALSDDRPVRSNTTAEEMLRADYLASTGAQSVETTEVNPYTHPALYYAMMAKRRKEREQAERYTGYDEEHALEAGDPQASTIERDFGSGTPSLEPSTAASSNKRRSLGSFV